jgi:hypothetical protein
MCPISRRAAKRDIRYLDADDRRHLADQVLSLRLATYRYREPLPSAASHLGFVIDDVAGPSPSIASDGDHVDLYGYTSMAVAAIQQQAAEIAALRAEVASLRARLSEPAQR